MSCWALSVLGTDVECELGPLYRPFFWCWSTKLPLGKNDRDIGSKEREAHSSATSCTACRFDAAVGSLAQGMAVVKGVTWTCPCVPLMTEGWDQILWRGLHPTREGSGFEVGDIDPPRRVCRVSRALVVQQRPARIETAGSQVRWICSTCRC